MQYHITMSRRQKIPLSPYAVGHIAHCLDFLRQDVMCTADDTLMPSIAQEGGLRKNQIMQCRDWDALGRWAKEPTRDACFHQISDYRHIEHSLEQHAFCAPDSPYYEVWNKYFEIHGHKNLFEDENRRWGLGIMQWFLPWTCWYPGGLLFFFGILVMSGKDLVS